MQNQLRAVFYRRSDDHFITYFKILRDIFWIDYWIEFLEMFTSSYTMKELNHYCPCCVSSDQVEI